MCPAEPADPLQRLAVDFTRVAGQGRKYGIHLLLAAQRPDKLPTNVLSQCDNLLLMRANSAGDGPALASMLLLQLVEFAGTFELEESLLAGKVLASMFRRLPGEASWGWWLGRGDGCEVRAPSWVIGPSRSGRVRAARCATSSTS